MNKLRAIECLRAAVLLIAAAGAPVFAEQLPDFVELVERSKPAIVNISTTKKVALQRRLSPDMEIPEFPEDSLFGELFRRFFGEGEGFEHFDTKSLGSGFIISADGYIVTNHHVVKDADEIVVRLSDRREFAAKLVGRDPRSDVALLKITAQELPVLRLGNSQELRVGEWVLAIGSPFGFEHSVTAGIVSAKGRSLPNENYVPFIQTDVAINPGNSGGPLFNLKGEVVGINAQIYSRTGGFMGLSFAIPIEVAVEVVDQLKSKGYVARGWLGVYIQEVTGELAESFRMDKPSGALVAKVLPASPAEKAGIRVGDIILEFDHKAVANSAALPPIVGRTTVGNKVKVRLIRDGREMSVKVKLGELPAEDKLAQAIEDEGAKASLLLGMDVAELTSEVREQLDIEEGGILVQQVKEGPAKEAGIRKGDVLMMLNNEKIKDVSHLRALVDALPKDKSTAVLVQRASGPVFLAMKVPE